MKRDTISFYILLSLSFALFQRMVPLSSGKSLVKDVVSTDREKVSVDSNSANVIFGFSVCLPAENELDVIDLKFGTEFISLKSSECPFWVFWHLIE